MLNVITTNLGLTNCLKHVYMAKVLAVEDDEPAIRAILGSLSASGYEVQVARSGRDGIAKLMTIDYDIVTLDWKLRDIDGLTILGLMRSVGIDTPVLFLSSISTNDECVKVLRAGADGYLTKPFALDEMIVRVEVLLRRRALYWSAHTYLRVGALELDLVKREATHRGKLMDLQPLELRLLEYLMRHPEQVLTRTTIFEAVWGSHLGGCANLVDVYIGRLRKKMEGTEERPLIRTVRGSGYLLT